MGNVGSRSAGPATSSNHDTAPNAALGPHRTGEATECARDEQHRSTVNRTLPYNKQQSELPSERKARVVSFQLPPSTDHAHVGWLRLRYHETVARAARIAWLNRNLPVVANALRSAGEVPPRNRSRGLRSRSSRKGPERVRPLARVSRRRWHQSTLICEAQLLKSCWPVRQTEHLFLPAFPVDERRDRRYRQRVHLADGAFGRVFQVCEGAESRQPESDRPLQYALKVYRKSDIIASGAVQQLRDEVNIQTVCGHHPFIVRCIDFWQTRTHIFLLSKYYGNGEFFQRLKTFCPELSRLYVAELALAIDFLHNAGIIYRDLKPENILLDQEYNIKLIDFGLSKWLSIGSRTATLCGTVQYMAPEIIRAEPYAHAVDWWALGVLACRMYTGQFPFTDLARHLRLGNPAADGGAQVERPSEATCPTPPPPPPPTLPSPSWALPEAVDQLAPAERDLLQRLLQPDARSRLRSLLQLQRIALYRNYRWDDVRTGKISPKQYIDDKCLEMIEQEKLEDPFSDF